MANNKDDIKDTILEVCAVSCTTTSRILKAAAYKADDAAKYCRSKQKSKVNLGFSFNIGSKKWAVGSAK